jgi:hypothetical protein
LSGDGLIAHSTQGSSQFSYFVRAEGADRHFVLGPPGLGDENLIGYPGDTLVHENVRVSLVESNEFDTVEIEILP